MYLFGSFTAQQTNLFFFQLQKERIHDVVAYMDGLLLPEEEDAEPLSPRSHVRFGNVSALSRWFSEDSQPDSDDETLLH